MGKEKIILNDNERNALATWLEVFILQEIRYFFTDARMPEMGPEEAPATFNDINYFWSLYSRLMTEETVTLEDIDAQILMNAMGGGIADVIIEGQIADPYWTLIVSELWKKCYDYCVGENPLTPPAAEKTAGIVLEETKKPAAAEGEKTESEAETAKKIVLGPEVEALAENAEEAALKIQNLRAEKKNSGNKKIGND